jgi:SAM-dependent methyltransferase
MAYTVTAPLRMSANQIPRARDNGRENNGSCRRALLYTFGALVMIKYCLAAAAAKGFSCSPLTKRMYRALGNSLGAKRRASEQMPAYYLHRVNRMLRIARTFGIPKDGDKLIELGTGWLHWEAITTRLFFDVRGVLYDVWDNRQLSGLKNYLSQLDQSLDRLSADAVRRDSARRLISKINEITSYDDLYEFLGFEFVLDPRGNPGLLNREAFDLVVSAGVLEHVHVQDAADFVHGIATVLKPGGYSVHSINLRDHLQLYDTAVATKQYLQYSERLWKVCFENDVQYINRIQRSDWLALFTSAGLTLEEEIVEQEDVSNLKLAQPYEKYDREDLGCGGLELIHRKPM